jgi:hypothetical protein
MIYISYMLRLCQAFFALRRKFFAAWAQGDGPWLAVGTEWAPRAARYAIICAGQEDAAGYIVHDGGQVLRAVKDIRPFTPP